MYMPIIFIALFIILRIAYYRHFPDRRIALNARKASRKAVRAARPRRHIRFFFFIPF